MRRVEEGNNLKQQNNQTVRGNHVKFYGIGIEQ
jgi:hypothetical protein